MNTSKYMPYKSISPNILVRKGFESCPGLYGTGFFVTFPPFDSVFYVTARHCVKDILQENSETSLMIPISPCGDKVVKFECVLETNIKNCPDEDREDVAIYVVSTGIDKKDHSILLERAFALQHQDDVVNMLDSALSRGSNLRVLGYPIHSHPNCATKIDYEVGQIKIQPRGFYGKLSSDGLFPDQYSLIGVSWKEGDYRGFSGSPVVELAENLENPGNMCCLLVGVVLMASQNTVRFLSINVVCNTIAAYLFEYRKAKMP